MTASSLLETLARAPVYDLTQGLSIFTPPFPGDHALQIHFFKRITGAYGGGQGANGQLIQWSNTVGTHLVGERAFFSAGRTLADVPLRDVMGRGVIVDISDLVGEYDIITPEMITSRADVRKGDILIVNTGFHRYSWDQPDIPNPNAQGGVENKEFGFLVRHPGPSIEFYRWAIDMQLKIVGFDCGSAEHPMNTPIRWMHASEFEKAEAKAREKYGKSWDELFPPEEYYRLMHQDLPKNHVLLLEAVVGQIDELLNQRAYILALPLPFMEVPSSWTRVIAYRPPADMDEEAFFDLLDNATVHDLTLPFSVQTPQWANYEPLSVRYHRRVGGQKLGFGRNEAICKASFHLATHMDGEKHFWANGRTIGEVPIDYWIGPAALADISHLMSDLEIYTPEMIESVVEVREGDILLIKTGWHKYGWNSPDADEFRYMTRHPGPSPDFSDWAVSKKIKWIGIDAVSQDHPMNTIQRLWHPQVFEEAREIARRKYGKDWDEVYPQDKYYQDTHLNLFPKGIVHAENLGNAIAHLSSGRYYVAALLPKGMECASMWGRFILLTDE
ncbi:hypothetical protein ARMA_2329 [Ardenticatena maritima]|uniref:Cyclase n=1 Tax=Ardenticatena maritima TaxID=872965 RepID=A0A0M8KAY9_9CHLR|nr:cyclase family protein [Ardenticatena maritima]GAP63906.1 hypothetical protein ARMA_2329 [Ardenticatena maritima]